MPFATTATAPLLVAVPLIAFGAASRWRCPSENHRWVWLVCSAAILVSLLVMRPLRDEL